MRILITFAGLLKCFGLDRLFYCILSTRAAALVYEGNIARAIFLLERMERFLYLSRSSHLLHAQYRLANLYEQAGRTQDAVVLYEGMLRRRLPIAMGGNVRSRLADIQMGVSRFAEPQRSTWTRFSDRAVS